MSCWRTQSTTCLLHLLVIFRGQNVRLAYSKLQLISSGFICMIWLPTKLLLNILLFSCRCNTVLSIIINCNKYDNFECIYSSCWSMVISKFLLYTRIMYMCDVLLQLQLVLAMWMRQQLLCRIQTTQTTVDNMLWWMSHAWMKQTHHEVPRKIIGSEITFVHCYICLAVLSWVHCLFSCSDFHVNGALQIFYDDDDELYMLRFALFPHLVCLL